MSVVLNQNLVIPPSVAAELAGFRQDLVAGQVNRERYLGFLNGARAAGDINHQLRSDLEVELNSAAAN